ncbi:MAG: asparagine synthase (glutamine-hydrolyzing), partial [Cyclobacteriaceae bacterium]|nr:asparagine synthase (glutamine-hydrolyzing) [Cyclobacteriaceae bacterium]
MCGINLIVDRTGKANLDALKHMMDKTVHRGPDQGRMKIIGKENYQVLFGVNRLRIMDENTDSDQPFHEKDEACFLLYNGEIYNQVEIRNHLIRKGIHFSTFSDTEVLFHYLKENPLAASSGLHGMYAYVFIDFRKEVLAIARDPWGMKPLYFYLDDRYFIVSSEIRGILASGLVRSVLNVEQIPFYFRYRFSNPPNTLLKNIQTFMKGITCRFGLDDFKLLQLDRSDNPPDENTEINPREGYFDNIDDQKLLAEVEELLIDSMITHTQSVRSPGLFLSGGVDSTLLLALAANHRIHLPNVFSIVNSDQDRDFGTEDYKYVRMAVQQYHPSSSIIEMDHSMMYGLDDFIGRIDHPVADPAFFLTYQLSALASKTTNVVLSGAGADELFGGYNRHAAFYHYLQHRKKIKFFTPLIKNFLRVVPTGYSYVGRKNLLLLKKLFNKVTGEPWQTYDNFLSFEKLSPSVLSPEWDLTGMTDPVNQIFLLALERDRQEYLPEDVLAVNDRACMLNSVEIRMPYLEEKVGSLIRRIRPDRLVSGGRKWILKSLLKKHGGGR